MRAVILTRLCWILAISLFASERHVSLVSLGLLTRNLSTSVCSVLQCIPERHIHSRFLCAANWISHVDGE